jgi:hypothetical protein
MNRVNWGWILCVAALALGSGCAPETANTNVARDTSGVVLGTRTWEPITLQASNLTIHGDVSLLQKWERNSLPSRYQERITLAGGSLFYEWLYAGGFRESDPRTIRSYLDQYHKISANGFTLSDVTRRFQSNGKLYYLAGSKGSMNCVSFFLEGSVRATYTNAAANAYLCRTEDQMAKSDLEKLALDMASRIDFADEGKVNRARAVTAAVAPVATNRQGNRELRALAVQWEQYSHPVAGTIELVQGGRSGAVRLTLPNSEGNCEGTYALVNGPRGTWNLACSNGLTAQGTMEAHGAARGSTGVGTDSQGRAIRFTLAGAQ